MKLHFHFKFFGHSLAMSEKFPPTSRSKLKRLPARGSYDKEAVHGVLNEGLVAHVGFVTPDGPVVIPMAYGREGDILYLHGSNASRLIKKNAIDSPVCVTVTLLDGIVVARSLFHSSMNYRSVVIFGQADEVTGRDEVIHALKVITEHLIPNRWDDARGPNETELISTKVLQIQIDEATVKIRTGGPGEEEEDLALNTWAGVIPLKTVIEEPIPDPVNAPKVPCPDYIRNYKNLNK